MLRKVREFPTEARHRNSASMIGCLPEERTPPCEIEAMREPNTSRRVLLIGAIKQTQKEWLSFRLQKASRARLESVTEIRHASDRTVGRSGRMERVALAIVLGPVKSVTIDRTWMNLEVPLAAAARDTPPRRTAFAQRSRREWLDSRRRWFTVER